MTKAVSHEKVYGLAAVLALYAKRPDEVQRIAYAREARMEIRELLRDAAARRIAYEERTDEELSKIAGAVHHEGIVIAARPRAVFALDALIDRISRGTWRTAIALDDVGNPHNVGAIARSAAFFGADAIMVASESARSPIVPAAVRVAQGGMEHLSIVRVPDLAPALAQLSTSRISVIGADVRDAMPITKIHWPERFVLVLGNEGGGIDERVRAACGVRVMIPGSGVVESLNVSVAAGVLLSAWSSSRASRGSAR